MQLDNSLLVESRMCLQDLFSVRLNFSKCWFLAGSSHQIIVSHPAPVNVNRSNVIWDVSGCAEIYPPLACKADLFSLSCAQRPPCRCLRTPETRKQLSLLQTRWTSLALVEQKLGFWRPVWAFKSETEKIRIHRIKIHITCYYIKRQETRAKIQLYTYKLTKPSKIFKI